MCSTKYFWQKFESQFARLDDVRCPNQTRWATASNCQAIRTNLAHYSPYDDEWEPAIRPCVNRGAQVVMYSALNLNRVPRNRQELRRTTTSCTSLPQAESLTDLIGSAVS